MPAASDEPPAPAQADGQRRVLLAVTGLTPQVVTETLYALLHEYPSAMPHEVHILTTAEGAQRARLALLSDQPGWFHRFMADYRLPSIEFDASHIHVLEGPDGQPLADIRTAEDNACAADQIADAVRRLTADAQTQLHVSLAGGRKTMGFFAGYALSLWGREGDRLTHVLVSDPYESSWDFFYPTPHEHIIEARNGKLADCRQAEVTLADIPFVRLRHGLPPALLQGQAGFAKAVLAAQIQLGPPRLAINLTARWIEAAGQRIELAPAELATLSWFARRSLLGEPGLERPSSAEPSPMHARAYLAEYRRILGPLGDDGRATARYRDGMSQGDFDERKSKLKRALTQTLGPAAQPYLVVGEGRAPMRYRLALPAQALSFV